MLRITVLTLFPEMFTGILTESILKRALEQNLVQVELVNIRDYATDRHRTVDDYPFGGGAGMVLKPGPVFAAVDAVTTGLAKPAEIVLLSPQGQHFSQDLAKKFATDENVIIICGHYEGFDERIRDELPTCEVSLGDFVMTGGEIAAMAIMDAVIRLVPGVLGNVDSADSDSFSAGLLEHPHYTRPAEFRDSTVPPVLLSGDHARIAKWRRQQSLYRTWQRRPELLDSVDLNSEEQAWIAQWEQGDTSNLLT